MMARTPTQRSPPKAHKRQSPTRKKLRKKRTDPFKLAKVLIDDLKTVEEALDYVKSICEEHFGSALHDWLKKEQPRSNRDGTWILKMRCTFFHTAGCEHVIRIVKPPNNRVRVEEGTNPHNDHSEKDRKTGMTKQEKAIIFSSPSKVAMKPSKLCASARNKTPVSTKKRNQIMRYQQNQRVRNSVIRPGQTRQWGGMLLACEARRKKELVAKGLFTEHSVFTLGVKYKPDHNVFVAIFSSENLLLNAYRQASSWGQPLLVAADTSYRLTQEGNGVYPICTVSPGQQTKTIAYAILSKEHSNIQKYIFGKVKYWVEKVVAVRLDRGDTYV